MSGIDLTAVVTLVVIVTAISIIDLRTLRIPNSLNFSLLLCGACVAFYQSAHTGALRLLIALMVFCLLSALARWFQRLRGKSGLGLGDVKMLSIAGVWISPLNLPILLFVASGTALAGVIGYSAISKNRIDTNRKIPFGPFIGVSLVFVFLLERFGTLGT